MPTAVFEVAIPASESQETQTLAHAAICTGSVAS